MSQRRENWKWKQKRLCEDQQEKQEALTELVDKVNHQACIVKELQ